MIANLFAIFAASNCLNVSSLKLANNIYEISQKCLEISEIVGLDCSIEDQNFVKDLSGNVFIVQEGKEIGYMVFDPISQKPIETVFSSTSPYNFDLVYENYYLGPSNYYFNFKNLSDDSFFSCLNEDVRINLDTAFLIQQDFDNKLNYIRDDSNYNKKNTKSLIQNNASFLETNIFVDNYYFITQETYPDNNDNECGYVAASILLNYWNKTMHKGTVPDKFYDDGQLYTGLNSNRNLKYELLNLGNNVKESYPWSIADVLNLYCEKYNIDGYASWTLLNFDIISSINLDNPVIIFGDLPNPLGNNLIMHAVVCYGYRLILQDAYYFVNYGWGQEYNEVLIHPGFLVGGTTSFSLNSSTYEKEYSIAPSEYGFPNSYCTSRETKIITKDDLSFETNRYRCGFIENEYVNISARKQGFTYAYLEYKFEDPIKWLDINLSFWSDDERFASPNNAFAAIQYKNLYSDDWITAIDLLNDVDLSTDRTHQNHLSINFYEKAREFRVVAHFYNISGLNDRNKGRISIGNITFCICC